MDFSGVGCLWAKSQALSSKGKFISFLKVEKGLFFLHELLLKLPSAQNNFFMSKRHVLGRHILDYSSPFYSLALLVLIVFMGMVEEFITTALSLFHSPIQARSLMTMQII